MRPIKYHPNNPPTIAIIGEAPGANEMRVGQPFVGPEGQYMNKLLNIAGLNRFDCFISNTVQEQPPRNDYSLLRQDQLEFGRKELIEDLTNYRDKGLTTVIAVGAKAMELLTGKTGIYRYRGTALPCTLVEGLKVYSTIHPGNILRGEGKYEPIFILDVKKAIADSKTAEITYPYRNIQIISTEQEAIFQLSLITNIDTPVVIDIETAGPKMTAFGWAISPHQAYVLDSKILENPTVLNYLGRFASSSTPKIFHNALFDVFHGAYYYQILYKNIDFDTMIAQHSAYPTLPKSLGFCASIYTNEPYWKCLKGDVEVLTKYGWKRLDKLEDDEEVMVSTINGELQFERTKTISFDFEGVGYKVETLRHNCWYTPDHNILTEPLQRNSRAKIAAKDLTMRKNIITSGNFYHGTVFYKSIKLLVAIQADGHIDGNKVYFNLTKQRKVDRLYKLCKELEIDIKVSAGSIQRKRLECSIDGEVVLEIINRLGKNKDFNAWLLDMCPETLDAFLNELPLWDGWKTFNGDALNYSSNNWNNIQWVSTIGHLRNKLCHIGHAAGKDKNGWKVSIKDNYSAAFKPPQRKEEYFKGKVYCLNTSTGFFLARSNNHIFITGNSEGKEAMEELKRGILSWDKLYIYNGKDCCLTYEIYIALKQELTDWDVWEVFNERMAMLPACLYAQMRGLLLDKEACKTLAQKNEKAIDTLEYMKEQVIGDINIRSSKQLSELIYGQWGMPVHKKGGRVTTEEKKLRMMLRYPTPYSAALGLILELKERYKLRDFYNVKTDEDGRVRCSMKITGTYTGRLATSASITGSGMNLQNIPKSVRVIYKADPSKILCQCDLSQSEARIVAALCGDVGWLKAFDERDLHKEVAAFLYGIPLEKVQKETHRLIAKRVAHGTHYGMGYMLLSEIIECPPKEAKRLREKYIELRNGIKTWHTRVKQQIREKRFIRTPFGVVIQFFGPIGNLYDTDDDAAVGKIMREAVAAEPQSTSVSYINRGIIKCFEVIPEFDFLLQVHDSILFQVDDDLETLQHVLPQIKELIEVPLTVNNITFSIPLNFEIGYNWGNMTEMKSLNELETAYKELKK